MSRYHQCLELRYLHALPLSRRRGGTGQLGIIVTVRGHRRVHDLGWELHKHEKQLISDEVIHNIHDCHVMSQTDTLSNKLDLCDRNLNTKNVMDQKSTNNETPSNEKLMQQGILNKMEPNHHNLYRTISRTAGPKASSTAATA